MHDADVPILGAETSRKRISIKLPKRRPRVGTVCSLLFRWLFCYTNTVANHDVPLIYLSSLHLQARCE